MALAYARTLLKKATRLNIARASSRPFSNAAKEEEELDSWDEALSEFHRTVPNRIEGGCVVCHFNGEDVWCPHMSRTLEWVLTCPPDFHCFSETPVIKRST